VLAALLARMPPQLRTRLEKAAMGEEAELDKGKRDHKRNVKRTQPAGIFFGCAPQPINQIGRVTDSIS
jgi:hypothetical protein